MFTFIIFLKSKFIVLEMLKNLGRMNPKHFFMNSGKEKKKKVYAFFWKL